MLRKGKGGGGRNLSQDGAPDRLVVEWMTEMAAILETGASTTDER